MKYAVLNLPLTSEGEHTFGGRMTHRLRHPVYAWLGLRPVLAQHTAAEHAAIQRWAAGRSTLVEIGVAEGVSAMALREGMRENGTLYLIDPYHLSRVPALNFMKRAAHRAVSNCPRGNVVWIEKFSQEAARDWNAIIDLLLIDGDHSESAVERDWNDWSHFVKPGGVVIFHDARVFEDGWPGAEWGPVKLVNKLFRSRQNHEWLIVEEVHSLCVVERGKK
ncbi:MAG: class I SAM-dependent methyltransferase [Candidatus Acidiferrales bacterium]